jgi:hypothetical protein
MLFSSLRQSFRDETLPMRSNDTIDHLTTRRALHVNETRMIYRLKLILVTLLAGAFMIWAPTAGHAHAGHKHDTAPVVTAPASERSGSALDQQLPSSEQAVFVSRTSTKATMATQLPCGGSCCSNLSCCSAAIASHPNGLDLPARYGAEPPMLSPSPNTSAILAGPSEPPRSFA